MVKVLISYDMQEGREQECQEYLVNKLAPGLARLGFNLADVWYTVWGNSPQILSGGEVADMAEVQRIFLSPDWEELSEHMRPMTANFSVRVMKSGR